MEFEETFKLRIDKRQRYRMSRIFFQNEISFRGSILSHRLHQNTLINRRLKLQFGKLSQSYDRLIHKVQKVLRSVKTISGNNLVVNPSGAVPMTKTSWSADGTRIAYTSPIQESEYDVSWVSTDGSQYGIIVTNGWHADWQH
jgi:hypothetical protein